MSPLIKLGIIALEAIFVAGTIGTAVVLVCVGFQVVHSIFEPRAEEESQPEQ